MYILSIGTLIEHMEYISGCKYNVMGDKYVLFQPSDQEASQVALIHSQI
mgnify:CR=1 FL=1